MRHRSTNAHLKYIISLLHKLAMQVNGIFGDTSHRVVLAEDVLGGLLVVGFCVRLVLLARFGEGVRFGAVTRGMCLVSLEYHTS